MGESCRSPIYRSVDVNNAKKNTSRFYSFFFCRLAFIFQISFCHVSFSLAFSERKVAVYSTPVGFSFPEPTEDPPNAIEPSRAIISARMSRTCYNEALISQAPYRIISSEYIYLGYCLVVDADKVLWLRVHLQGLEEGQSCIKSLVGS